MEKHLFIITSAIKSGQNEKERFLQTLHTIDSIKLRVKNCDIWLCDSSLSSLDPYMTDLLTSVNYVDFSQDNRVKEIRDEVKKFKLPCTENVRPFYELGALKNLTESYMINKVFSEIKKEEYKRIFKISGRYFLTDRFNLESHLIEGKFILKEKVKSPLGKIFTKSDYSRFSITWDFCTSIFEPMKYHFLEIENYIKNQLNSGLLADIEHGLELCIPSEFIHESKIYGVIGIVNNGKNIIHFDS